MYKRQDVYGPKKSKYTLEGQCLHAKVLGFVHPRTGEYMELSLIHILKFGMNGDISELSIKDIIKTTKSDKKMVGDKIKARREDKAIRIEDMCIRDRVYQYRGENAISGKE